MYNYSATCSNIETGWCENLVFNNFIKAFKLFLWANNFNLFLINDWTRKLIPPSKQRKQRIKEPGHLQSAATSLA